MSLFWAACTLDGKVEKLFFNDLFALLVLTTIGTYYFVLNTHLRNVRE